MVLLFYLVSFLLGLAIGSFLNCVIYRLEKEESLMGRSYCPGCKHTLGWLDLIPLFSFLFLGGRCRYCGAKISVQYPLVEMLTGLVFVLIVANSAEISHFLNLAFLFYIASVLLVIFIYDLKHFIIPDKILFPAIAVAFLYRLVFNFSDFYLFIIAAFIASSFFFVIFLISRGQWMGFGDVKLAILLGLVLGFPNILAGLFLAFLFGAIIGSGAMFSGKKGLKSEIPFAPFLIAGTFTAMCWGSQIINGYIHFLVF